MLTRFALASLLVACSGSAAPVANEPARELAGPTAVESAPLAQDAGAEPEGTVLQTAEPGRVGIEELRVGDGATARQGDRLVVHYTGTLTDGSEFDSSRARSPFEFRLGARQVIAGWELGIEGMKVGGRRKLTIPPDLAYGERGHPPVIPPNATLLFDVELLSVE